MRHKQNGGPKDLKFAALYRHAQADIYGRSFSIRTALQVLVLLYLGQVLFHPRKQVDSTGKGPSMYQSPEGLLMTLSQPLPPALLSLHFWAAVLLVGACLLQKHVAMALYDKWASRRTKGAANLWLARRYTDQGLRSMHRNLGYATLLFIVGMAFGGYLLQESSTFRNVESVMVLFVAPWGVFVVGMLVTVTYDMWLTHAVLGDAIFKGSCIAVPLTRVLTAFLQSPPEALQSSVRSFIQVFEMDGVGPVSKGVDIPLDTAYYVAIGVASLVVGIWQTSEVIALLAASPPQTVN